MYNPQLAIAQLNKFISLANTELARVRAELSRHEQVISNSMKVKGFITRDTVKFRNRLLNMIRTLESKIAEAKKKLQETQKQVVSVKPVIKPVIAKPKIVPIIKPIIPLIAKPKNEPLPDDTVPEEYFITETDEETGKEYTYNVKQYDSESGETEYEAKEGKTTQSPENEEKIEGFWDKILPSKTTLTDAQKLIEKGKEIVEKGKEIKEQYLPTTTTTPVPQSETMVIPTWAYVSGGIVILGGIGTGIYLLTRKKKNPCKKKSKR